jgi:hypothetical protein
LEQKKAMAKNKRMDILNKKVSRLEGQKRENLERLK